LSPRRARNWGLVSVERRNCDQMSYARIVDPVLLELLCSILPIKSPAPLRFSSNAEASVPFAGFTTESLCRLSLSVLVPFPLSFLHSPGEAPFTEEDGEDPGGTGIGFDKRSGTVMEFTGDDEGGVVEGVETASSVESPGGESSASVRP
jgi:hypothetical protein